MAEIWGPLDISVYREWVSAIIYEASDRLNDWEINFIHSIDERLLSGRNLTQAQAETLEKIYVRKTK